MPLVSIIIPCFNEQDTIQLVLQAILDQIIPLSEMEVIISDGMSTDRTREAIEEFGQSHPQLKLRVVDNVDKNIPSALNCAIKAANGGFIVRLDAHSIPYPDYVQRCVEHLQDGHCDNIGGVWEIKSRTSGWLAQSIAAAAAHRLGAGNASYRLSENAKPEYVDTVPFGAFRKSLFDEIGLFDENLLTNEDYEFNTRLRESGRRIWLDPAIRCVYFSRENLRALARQYWRYGFWKWRMVRQYPGSIRPRQVLPPLFAASLILLTLLVPFWIGFAVLLGIEIFLYLIILIFGVFSSALKNKDLKFLLGMPLAIITMHLSWGTGFIWSMLRSAVSPPTKAT